MSRRRESYQVLDPVTTDDLLRAMYGERTRHEAPVVQGCSAGCCGPLVLDGGAVEARVTEGIWRDIRWALGLELAAVALLLLAAAGWRAIGGWTPW